MEMMNIKMKITFRLRPSRFREGGIFLALLLGFSWTSQGQQLETYIEEAIGNNPNIQAVEKRYAIATEKISESRSLPNTDFSAGYMLGKEEMPTMWQGELSVMQMLPWFGTIPAREKYAMAMAEADFLEIEIEKRRIIRDLSQTYFRLYEIAKKQEVFDSNIQLLQVYEQMALTSVEVGQASAVSVLRLQMRQNDLLEKKEVLEQDYAAELTIFNTIMNRDKVENITIVDSLIIPESDTEIDFERLNLHPELTKFEQLNNVVSQADALNKKERAPQLGVGMEYMLFTEMADMYMPMVSLSIPIFNKKYKSIAKQNKLRHAEIESQKEANRNDLISQLQATVRRRNAARISLETQEKNIKQARQATEILFKNYETGTIDFKEVLDVQELQLSFQISHVKAIGDYFKQTSIIDYYTNNINQTGF